jgi:hypothetical protein
VPEYRCYEIRKDGHVDKAPTDFDAPDDRAGVAAAKKPINGHDIEIWQGPRVVAYLTPDEE